MMVLGMMSVVSNVQEGLRMCVASLLLGVMLLCAFVNNYLLLPAAKLDLKNTKSPEKRHLANGNHLNNNSNNNHSNHHGHHSKPNKQYQVNKITTIHIHDLQNNNINGSQCNGQKTPEFSPLKNDKETVSNTVSYYVQRHGYQFEEHKISTNDGFILILQRILPKQQSTLNGNVEPNNEKELRHPVILQHGLFQSSGVFVTNEENSLAFYLVDHGYDVWLGNNRGIGLGHKRYKTHDREFWDWSVDELAKYDVPAIVDHVLTHTGHSKVTWIGHSQGNGQAFMAMSKNQELAKKNQFVGRSCSCWSIGRSSIQTFENVASRFILSNCFWRKAIYSNDKLCIKFRSCFGVFFYGIPYVLLFV